jgi:predicted dinucleotide-binding enzyme
MKIGVIGCGRMGIALGAALSRIGERVTFATRDPARVTALCRDAGIEARVGSHDALSATELIVLATSWEDTRRLLDEAPPLGGKIVLSCVNPSTRDNPLSIGHTSSAGEQIAGWAAGARVVEAFNGTYAEALDLAPGRETRETVLYCGDDDEARDTAGALIRRLGFDALDAGPLRNARYLEPLAQLAVYLVRIKGYGPLGIHQEWPRLAPNTP